MNAKSSLVACLFAFLAWFAPAFADEAKPAADPAALAAARDLMEVTGVAKQMEGMISAMSQGFAKGAGAETSEKGKQVAAEFDAAMKKFMGYKDEMLTDFAQLYAETFTAAEMKEIADFYRGGTGAKFIQSMPVLMQKGAQIGIKYSERIVKEMGGPGATPAAKQ
jgi:uncharacterized protein